MWATFVISECWGASSTTRRCASPEPPNLSEGRHESLGVVEEEAG